MTKLNEEELNKRIKFIWNKVDFQKVFDIYSKTRSYDITSILQGIVDGNNNEIQKIIDYVVNAIKNNKYEMDRFFKKECTNEARDKYYKFICKNSCTLSTNVDSEIKNDIKNYAKELLSTYKFTSNNDTETNSLATLVRVGLSSWNE